jgi:hypothetical protein
MKHVTRLALILLASAAVPGHLCKAGEDVPADTRYKSSQRDSVSERPAPPRVTTVQTVNTRTSRRDAPRWRRVGTNWYYARASELPWWGNAPGD